MTREHYARTGGPAMTGCDHHYIDPDGLACTRDTHDGNGHVYEASWAADSVRDEE